MPVPLCGEMIRRLFFIGLTLTLAQACVPENGKYCDDGGVLQVCGVGFYCAGTAGQVACPPGHYCPAGSSVETDCPVNTYNPGGMVGSEGGCTSCGARKVSPAGSIAENDCHFCLANEKYNEQTSSCDSCEDGQFSLPDARVCSVCKPGEYATGTSLGCLPCRPGSYSTSYGVTACTSCGNSPTTYKEMYTFTTPNNNADGFPTAIWGATSSSQCRDLRAGDCKVGSYYSSDECIACLRGYYCPIMTTYGEQRKSTSLLACPNTKYSGANAMNATLDCLYDTTLWNTNYASCKVSNDEDVQALLEDLGVDVTAVATSKDGSIVFFTTATKLYKLMLDSLTFSAVNVANKNFADLKAVGVDQAPDKPQYVVLAEPLKVYKVDLYTGLAVMLGTQGEVVAPRGVAVRGDKAFVSDSTNHVIHGYTLSTKQHFVAAGSYLNPSYVDGAGGSAQFREPMGLSFLSNTELLVADKGNSAIRKIDTSLNYKVTTLFRSLDASHFSSPVDVFAKVVGVSPTYQAVYVVTSAGKLTHARQYPINDDDDDLTDWLTNELLGAPDMSRVVLTYKNGQDAMFYLAKTGTPKQLLSVVAGAEAPCHFPCKSGEDCVTQNTCGNYNLDLDQNEKCDVGDGCFAQNCTIKPGFACAGDLTSCLAPIVAYPYEYENNKYYTSEDCLLRPTPPGYTVNNVCGMVDIDECAAGTTSCAVYAQCLNTEPTGNKNPDRVTNTTGYTCGCQADFFGDGQFCNISSWRVYATYHVESLPKTSFYTGHFDTFLKNKFAEALIAPSQVLSGLSNPSTTLTKLQLAKVSTYVSLLPQEKVGSLFTLSTLFASKADADLVYGAATANAGAILNMLRTAISNQGLQQVQAPLTSAFQAGTFQGAVRQAGWGMNITGVTYNRKCNVTKQGGEMAARKGGCWEIEMEYQGGSDYSTRDETLQSLNALFLPKLDKSDGVTLDNVMQALTIDSGVGFPCNDGVTLDGKINPSGTACCLTRFNSMYRTTTNFTDFLASSVYTTAATEERCSAGEIEETAEPKSDILFNKDRLDGTTNDMVWGDIDGMEHSSIHLVETVDYSKRIYKVKLLLEEGDLREHASLIEGNLNAEYKLIFFVGLANFQPVTGMTPGTYTSMLQTRTMIQRVEVTKSNILSVSTYGANQVSFSF